MANRLKNGILGPLNLAEGLSMTLMRLGLLTPTVFLLGCGGNTGHLDAHAKDILTGATRVEVFRTAGNPRETSKRPLTGDRRIGGFPVIAQGSEQGPEFARRLAGILLDEQTYSPTFAKCYWPGIAFRVWKDEAAIDVLICFYCDNFYCGPPTDSARETASFWGSPARGKLVRLAKEAFPDDKDIQALSEETKAPP